MRPPAAIVLAAGTSRRLGQPKQLLQVEGNTLLDRAIRMGTEAGVSPLIVVLGAHLDEILSAAQLLKSEGVILVHNNEWEEGIASSIRAGIDALNAEAPKAPGALLLGCDQPRLTTDHLCNLIESFSRRSSPVIAASAYAGIVGTPAIFPRLLFPQLSALHGDQGARSLLNAASCPLLTLPFEGGEVDIDLPVDLQQLH